MRKYAGSYQSGGRRPGRRDGVGGSHGIFAVERGGEAEAGRIAAQDPKPGAGYFEWAMVHLVVSGPFSVEELPRDSNCVDRTDMGMEQFPVD